MKIIKLLLCKFYIIFFVHKSNQIINYSYPFSTKVAIMLSIVTTFAEFQVESKHFDTSAAHDSKLIFNLLSSLLLLKKNHNMYVLLLYIHACIFYVLFHTKQRIFMKADYFSSTLVSKEATLC